MVALHQSMTDAHFKRETSAHECGSGRRTRRAHLKIREARCLIIEGIDVRCFEDRIAHAGEIPHALVVRHDEDDVGLQSFQ